MGFLWDAFLEGFRAGKGDTAAAKQKKKTPDINDLLYPGELPTFQELAENGHKDKRALVYVFYRLKIDKHTAFTADYLYNGQDIGTEREAYKELKAQGMIKRLDEVEELEEQYTQDDLKKLLKERGLTVGGKKREQAQRLIESGYKPERKGKRKFTFTEQAKQLTKEKEENRQQAISRAADALKSLDYDGAITAYREYDSKWGFVHASGKKHTIFAHFDIPHKSFQFFERYPMQEVRNSEEYKKTLRGVLIAGLMRGCREEWDLEYDMWNITKEPLDCPKLLTMFRGYSREVLDNMAEQIKADNRNALTYYISHLEYLNRQ